MKGLLAKLTWVQNMHGVTIGDTVVTKTVPRAGSLWQHSEHV